MYGKRVFAQDINQNRREIMRLKDYLKEATTDDRQKSLDGLRKQKEHYMVQLKGAKDPEKKAHLRTLISKTAEDMSKITASIAKDREMKK